MDASKADSEIPILESAVQIQKKSWSELRGVVCEFRRRLSGVSDGSVPDAITFRSLPDGRLAVVPFLFPLTFFTSKNRKCINITKMKFFKLVF